MAAEHSVPASARGHFDAEDARRLRAAADVGTLPDERARAVVSVALGLAEDFGAPCAVVLLDPDGELQVAERSGALPGRRIASAIDAGRAALAGIDATAADPETAAVILRDVGGFRGALGISGGPNGFAHETCRQAARALGLR
jgi:uncharacterized protein GlcG (DUF336 family)